MISADPDPPRASPVRRLLDYQHLLSTVMYGATRLRFAPWKNWQIRWFVRRYGVDLAEAEHRDPGAYPHFNAFFTRALRAGMRPARSGAGEAVCPVDGAVADLGRLQPSAEVRAKGHDYALDAFLGGAAARADPFRGGSFVTLYLSPRDYHRVHMPLAGRLREMVYVPGRLFSVSPRGPRPVADVCGRNERVVSIFETDLGPLAVVLVGAFFVGSIEQTWSGVVTSRLGRGIGCWRYDGADAVRLERGEEMGRFNMGSTVVLLFGEPELAWRAGIEPGAPVRVGQPLAGFPPAGEGAGPSALTSRARPRTG